MTFIRCLDTNDREMLINLDLATSITIDVDANFPEHTVVRFRFGDEHYASVKPGDESRRIWDLLKKQGERQEWKMY